ncbi:MAG: SDR family NAD(P)-dependent oxidoreductase [Candidatus Nanopelagicales bacterium]
MATALITGATAGIGRAFADLLARQGFDLVLVARNEARLKQVAKELHDKHSVAVEVFRADLSRYDECAWVEQRLADTARPIEVLINNAGFAVRQRFAKGDLLAEQTMFDVLVRAVMRLSHAAAQGMVARGSGVIINVSSVAGWRHTSTYAASKAYVTSFSIALGRELRNRGVKVTALCPGFTHTEFHQRAGMDMKRLPEFMWLDADALVAQGWRDAQRNKRISVPGRQYQALRYLLKFWY